MCSIENILITYPDECSLGIRTNCRRSHYDVSVIQFFDCLRAEHNEKLHFFKTDLEKLHKTGLARFDSLDFDMIISYPACPEIEHYAEERGSPYFTFDHFARDSTYLDHFWLFNRNIIGDFQAVVDQLPYRPGSLSPLVNEVSYYGGFSPLRHNNADIFYRRDITLCLVLIDESLEQKNENILAGQLRAAIANSAHLLGDTAHLVLFGQPRKMLTRLANRLGRVIPNVFHVIDDTFGLSELNVYSMIQKSDLIFSCGSRLAVDAIVLKKPVVFVDAANFLSQPLNSLLTGSRNNFDLQDIGQKQHEYLSRLVSFIEERKCVIPNVACSADEFHASLSRVLIAGTGQGEPVADAAPRAAIVNREGMAIVSTYVDGISKSQGRNVPETILLNCKYRLLGLIKACHSKIK